MWWWLVIGCGEAPSKDAGADDAPAETDVEDTEREDDDDDEGPGDDEEDPVDDTPDPEDCADVCWSWRAPTPVAAPGAPVVIQQGTCNAGGVEVGQCPTGTTCGAPTTTYPAPNLTFTRPLCEGRGGSYAIAVDLSPPVSAPVPVALTFTLAGEAWPDGRDGAAGILVLVEPSLGAVVRAPMPTTPDPITLDLPVGVWSASFVASGLDDTMYPHVLRGGTLIVNEAGATEVDVEARAVTLSLVLDGQARRTVPNTTSRVDVLLRDDAQGVITRTRLTGERLDQPIVLPFGAWTPTVQSTGSEGSPFPTGSTTLAPVTVSRRASPDVALPLTTVPVDGGLTYNGDATRELVFVDLRGADGVVSRFIVDTRDEDASTWSGRVYAGTYDVLVDTQSAWSDMPRGQVLVQRGYQAGPSLPIALRGVEASGELTVNRVATTFGASDGELWFTDGADTWAFLSLQRSDGGRNPDFEGYLWSGATSVILTGHVDTLPAVPALVARNVRPATGLSLDVSAHAVTATIKPDGAAAMGNGGYRGSVAWYAVDPATDALIEGALPGQRAAGWVGASALPTSGPMKVSTLLPAGRWKPRLDAHDDGATPAGAVWIDAFDVNGPVNQTWELDTVDVEITLTEGGRRLDQAPLNADRGTIMVGSVMTPVPRAGDARVSVRTWRSTTDVLWLCAPNSSCGIDAPEATVLWTGIAW